MASSEEFIVLIENKGTEKPGLISRSGRGSLWSVVEKYMWESTAGLERSRSADEQAAVAASIILLLLHACPRRQQRMFTASNVADAGRVRAGRMQPPFTTMKSVFRDGLSTRC